jgi:tetratricopeptide (TPR) repeat protein
MQTAEGSRTKRRRRSRTQDRTRIGSGSQECLVLHESRGVPCRNGTEIERRNRQDDLYLQKIEPRTPAQSPERLRILEQLLNLNMELGLYESNEEFRRYDEAYDRWEAAGRRGPEPKLSSAKSQNQWRVVSTRAENLLRQFPKARNADETMFNLAVAYQFQKREKDAARAYTQLIQKYPNLPKAGDAYFQLGDFLLRQAEFPRGNEQLQTGPQVQAFEGVFVGAVQTGLALLQPF